MSVSSNPVITVTVLPTSEQKAPQRDLQSPPSHHVGNPPTSFQNPWPSFVKHSRWAILQTRFSKDRNLIPVPPRDELVQIHKPDWGNGERGLKATWIGHASFLVETTANEGAFRGIRVLLDPVWSERTSPVQWFGPKRYTPVPCTLQELPDVDIVAISHNHYDHLDVATITELYRIRKGSIHFFCGLGNVPLFLGLGICRDEVTELDWYQGVRVDVADVGSVKLTCTPSQHFSGRTPFDMGSTLWCSWLIEELAQTKPTTPNTQASHCRKLFFAGDTGYRSVPPSINTISDLEREPNLPRCPEFAGIGDLFGPIDLALLPIGLCLPRHFMSPVHCAPEDSVDIHIDIKSKRSIGMHWGTVRGGISAHYEDVREPPRRWREAAEKRGLVWGKDVGLLDIGETVVV